MTTIAWPRAPARPARPNLIESLAFGAAVFLMLIYSQGWTMPLTGGGDETSESGLLRAMFLPAYAVAVGLMALTPWTVVKGAVRQPFLIALMMIVALSLLWSVSPDQTSRRVFAVAFTTLGGIVLAARFSWATLAEVMAATLAILAVFCLLFGLFVPSLGRMTELFPGAWRGVWQEKNSLGDNMALGVVICASAGMLSPARRWLWWGFSVLCLVLVVLSTSKTSLVALALGVGALFFVALVRRGPVAGVAATWAAVVGVGLIAAVIVFASDAVFGLLGKDATLTGRTKIWAGVLRQIEQRPWLGYGYAAVWDETDRWGPLAWIVKDSGFRPHHAHNSWLEQWLGIGIPGLVAWGLFYMQTMVTAIIAVYRDKGAYLAFPFLIVFTLTSLTESIAVVYHDMRWVIFVALAVKLALPDPAEKVA